MFFQFVKRRKYWYLISLLIIIPGIISLAFRGLNLGIDFTGGNLIELQFQRQVELAEVRSVLAGQGLEQSILQSSGENQVIIRTGVISQEQNQALVEALDRELGGVEVMRNNAVGPVIGKELTQRALWALAIAAAAMVLYISWRFELKQGIAAVTALIHDGLVTLSLFSLFWLQVDTAFVAAVLTVLGYSINATIVIFDRIRENRKTAKKTEPLESIIDRSLWQTLARSINTALTVLFMLVALYFLGGTTLKTFVLALIIGIVSGTYSSIFISSQLWFDLREKLPKTKKPAGAEA